MEYGRYTYLPSHKRDFNGSENFLPGLPSDQYGSRSSFRPGVWKVHLPSKSALGKVWKSLELSIWSTEGTLTFQITRRTSTEVKIAFQVRHRKTLEVVRAFDLEYGRYTYLPSHKKAFNGSENCLPGSP
jgi:hypothetical protein